MTRLRCWKKSTKEQKKLAKIGLEWLDSQRLEVILIPAPEPKHHDHKIRVAIDSNPPWYSRMAQSRASSGSLRQRVRRALKRVLSGWCDPQGLEDEIFEELKSDIDSEFI